MSIRTYNNLSFSGSGTKSLPGDIAVTGNILVEAGAIVTLAGNDLEVNVNANRDITINGVVNINGNGRLFESGRRLTMVR